MGNEKKFKAKFNELDQLCQKVYPKCKKGTFAALKEFSKTLDDSSKSTLLNLISARNMNTHDENDIISFKSNSITFLQGLIDGLNRKYHNGLNIKINANNENLRTKNLKSMSAILNQVLNRYHFLSLNDLNNIKSKLISYIENEKRAKDYDSIRKHYFGFCEVVQNLEKEKCVQDVRNAYKKKKDQQAKLHRKANLEKAKRQIINKIEISTSAQIAALPVLAFNKKRNIKALGDKLLQAVNRCHSIDELENISEELDDAFDDYLDDFDY